MPGHYLSPEALALSTFRLVLALAALIAFALLARWPRPRLALGVVLAMHVAAWLVYRAPLQRPYGLGEGSDRTFNVGMAASVAIGHSPFEHTQVRHGSPEPLWNALVGGMAHGHPERAPAARRGRGQRARRAKARSAARARASRKVLRASASDER